MLANELHFLRKELNDRGIVFAYSGYITEQVLSSVGDALKQKLAIEDADTKTMRSVFAIFVEQMQNIIRYSAEQLPGLDEPDPSGNIIDLRYGILTIGQERSEYVVHSGNLVHAADVERIGSRLGALQAMSHEELRAAYKKQLRGTSDGHSKGAGIGLIEIARRASQPIEFDFMRVDANTSFFALKATI